MTEKTALVLCMVMLIVLSACDSGVSSGGGKSSNPPTRQEQQSPQRIPGAVDLGLEGRYSSKLQALNTSLDSGMILAQANIQVMADQISVSVNVKDSPRLTVHGQRIYQALECPSEIHDTNRDGYVDPMEARAVLGTGLIPLDGVLETQLEPEQTFPASDALGNYNYRQEGILSIMLGDLSSPDLDPDDQLAKLEFGKELRLEGRVIVIEGVNPDYLPGSIRSFPGSSARALMPIACGKLVRVMEPESETSEPSDLL